MGTEFLLSDAAWFLAVGLCAACVVLLVCVVVSEVRWARRPRVTDDVAREHAAPLSHGVEVRR